MQNVNGQKQRHRESLKPSKDNTFCWYPFQQLALKEWHYQRGILNASPCCNSIRPETPDPLGVKASLNNQPNTVMPVDIFHGAEMQELRSAMLEGRKHPACATCWKIEETGATSYRLDSIPSGFVKPSEEQHGQLIAKPELKQIDFAFGENCNLRCRMCAPGLSNKLRKDYQYFYENRIDTRGMQQFDYVAWHKAVSYDINLEPGSDKAVYNWANNDQWQNILDNIHTLNHIKATGGETLLSKPFIEFLDTAIERGVAKNILLEFHTNATKFTDNVIERLKQFEGLHLNISIDSVEKNYEYIRYPMTWDTVTQSLQNLLNKLQDVRSPGKPEQQWEERDPIIKNFSFNVVLSALNAYHLPELYQFQNSLIAPYNCWQWSVFYVDLLWPENKYINVKFLSPEIKAELLELYQSTEPQSMAQPKWDVACGFLQKHLDYEPTEQDRQNMLREITAFDKSRNQCYNDYLHPRIVEFLETPRA